MTPDPFIQLVIEKLINRPKKLSLYQIEKDIGISRQYLSYLIKGKFSDPSYTRITKINNYLSNQ